MGQKITVRDNGTPVYLGESDFAGPEGRMSYLQFVMQKLDKNVNNAYMIGEDCDDIELRCDGCYDEAYHELSNSYAWYEDGVMAVASAIIKRELTMLADSVVVKFITKSAGAVIKAATKKYLNGRFKAYTSAFPEIIPLSEFQKMNYGYLEAVTRFNLKFKIAGKWAEKLETQVAVRVYTRNKKPAFAVAYGAKSKDKTYNSEFVLIDQKYSKHLDYYTAWAHVDIGVMHPSISRTLKKLRVDWKSMMEKNKKMISESVEEAIADGRYLEKRLNVVEAYKAGVLTYEDADAYLDMMDLAGFETHEDFMYEEVDDLI